jgi:hypothetical protein
MTDLEKTIILFNDIGVKFKVIESKFLTSIEIDNSHLASVDRYLDIDFNKEDGSFIEFDNYS